MLTDILLAFIPLFVAVDVIGALPFFHSLTAAMDVEQRKGVIRDSILTAFTASVGFLFLGKLIFRALGISVPDFKTAGGIILLVLSINDLLFPQRTRETRGGSLGVVPLGMPLVVGPAVLTALLILADTYGYLITVLALLLNLSIVWFVFRRSAPIVRALGEQGSRAIGKVASLLLAAIAVSMIRQGVLETIQGWTP